RAVEADFYRRIEFGENGPGALGKSERLFLGKVDTLFECAGDDVEGDQNERHRGQTASGVKNGFDCLFLHRSSLEISRRGAREGSRWWKRVKTRLETGKR